MIVWPAQKSIVSAGTDTAVVGGPAAGFHRRGLAMCWVPASNFPHASTLPVGRSVIWSGTMFQDTGGSHLPVVASAGNAAMAIVEEVAVAAPVVNRRVEEPVPVSPRSVNVAEPFAFVVAVTAPWSTPGPVATVAVTTTPGTATPLASFTTTTGCEPGTHTSRSSALAGGCLLTRRVAAGPAAAVIPVPASGSGVGLVGSSSPQVIEEPARAMASSSRVVRRKRVIDIAGRDWR